MFQLSSIVESSSSWVSAHVDLVLSYQLVFFVATWSERIPYESFYAACISSRIFLTLQMLVHAVKAPRER